MLLEHSTLLAQQKAHLMAKTKELIALAIGVAARCEGGISFHTHAALKAGASREEITDALGVAVLMGGVPSVMYATHVIEAMDQFEEINLGTMDEFEEINI